MFDFDFGLGDDIGMLRESVRAFADDRIAPRAADIDRTNKFPRDLWPGLGELGLLGITVEEHLGGSGLGYLAHVVAMEELSRASASVGLSYGAHSNLCVNQLRCWGSDEQKARYLPRIAAGKLRLQAFGVTEPTVGSDTTRIQTTAERVDGGYVVSGQKVFTSRALYSDLMLLLARTTPLDEVVKRSEGLSVFLVDMKAAGDALTIRPLRTMMNHATTEVFLDGVELPADALVGEEGQGFRYILDGMNAERVLIAAECIGDGRWFVEKAARYASEREVFGRPIGANQGVQFPVARAYAAIEAADLMRYKAAWLFEQGEPAGAEANMAKLLASEASWAAANACLDTHGGWGFAEEYDVERKFRETRLYTIAPVSNNLILAYLGQHVLGMPRSY